MSGNTVPSATNRFHVFEVTQQRAFQCYAAVHVSVVIQAVKGGWTTLRADRFEDLSTAGSWARDFARESVEVSGPSHDVVTIASLGRGYCQAVSLRRSAYRVERESYYEQQWPVVVRGRQIVADNTGRLATSRLLPATRADLEDFLLSALRHGGFEEAASCVRGAHSFGDALDRIEILESLADGMRMEDELGRLRRTALNEAALNEVGGHLLWVAAAPRLLKGPSEVEKSWWSIDLFPPEANEKCYVNWNE